MNTYKATILESNQDYYYTAETPIDWVGMTPVEEHILLPSEVIQVPEVDLNVNWKLTKLAFLNRMTMQESISFYTFAENNIMGKILKDKLMAATYIDLKRSDCQAAIASLVAIGVLTQARAAEIEATPASEHEAYNG